MLVARYLGALEFSMKRNIGFFTAVLTVMLGGCASSVEEPFSSLEQQQLETVEFIRPYELSRTDVSHTALGEVVGESCQSTRFQAAPSQAEALLKLKLAAAQLGANRVILKQCQQLSSNDCRAIWICRGDAHQQQPLQ